MLAICVWFWVFFKTVDKGFQPEGKLRSKQGIPPRGQHLDCIKSPEQSHSKLQHSGPLPRAHYVEGEGILEGTK